MEDHGSDAGNTPSDAGAWPRPHPLHDEALTDLYEEWPAPATEPDDSGGR